MNQFNVGALSQLLSALTALEVVINRKRSEVGEIEISDEMREHLGKTLAQSLASSKEIAFIDCGPIIQEPLSRLQQGATLGMVECELRHATSGVIKELSRWKFVAVNLDRIEYFDRVALFGVEVSLRFPEATDDISESGNCIAVGCGTAAVFHLMRTAEHGLRKLAKRLHVKLTHKGQSQRVEYADWDKIITAAKNELTKAHALSAGPKRKAALEMYADAADHCLFMKDIWRNTISHNHRLYKDSEAVAVYDRVKDFMVFLAANLWKTSKATQVGIVELQSRVDQLP